MGTYGGVNVCVGKHPGMSLDFGAAASTDVGVDMVTESGVIAVKGSTMGAETYAELRLDVGAGEGDSVDELERHGEQGVSGGLRQIAKEKKHN